MANDLSQDAAEAVANWNDTRTIELRGLDVKHVIDAPVGERAFENIKCGQFAGLFDSQAALDEQFEQSPVPEAIDRVGPRITSIGRGPGSSHRGLPSLQRKGANLGHLAFEIKNRRCDACTRTRTRLFEAVPEKGVPSYRNGARGKGSEGGIGLGCPGADVGKERAQFDKPGICSPTHFFAGSRAAPDNSGASNSMRNIVADVARKNGGTVLYIGVLVCHVLPEVCKCDRF